MARGRGALEEAAHRVVASVHQHELGERHADVGGDLLGLLQELRPAEVLRNDHVVAGAQVHPRHLEGHRAREQAGLDRMVLPAAEHAAHAVEIEVQRERMLVDVALGQRRLADAGRTVEQDEPSGHERNSALYALSAGCPPRCA